MKKTHIYPCTVIYLLSNINILIQVTFLKRWYPQKEFPIYNPHSVHTLEQAFPSSRSCTGWVQMPTSPTLADRGLLATFPEQSSREPWPPSELAWDGAISHSLPTSLVDCVQRSMLQPWFSPFWPGACALEPSSAQSESTLHYVIALFMSDQS
jgi:hypothetical protein